MELGGATQIAGLAQAHALAQRLLPERYKRIDLLERYVEGTQYEGRQDFFAPATDVPLLERAPNIIDPIVLAAIRQHIDFAFGEGRWPKLTTGQAEDDDELDEESGLSPEDSKKFDAFLCKLTEHARLKKACETGLKAAEGTSTAAFILCARKGRLRIETTKSKWATPEFDADGTTVTRLVIEYPYIDIVRDDRTGSKRARVMVYRREIDDQRDRVFLPAEVQSEFSKIEWVVDKKKSSDHGLGFCPVIWYPFRKECDAANVIDGHAIHEVLLDELDALNFSLSQRGRAALYSGDPQLWERGVAKDEQVAPAAALSGDVVRHGKTADGHAFSLLGFAERPREARRKGAGIVWRYESEKAEVGMLTLPPGALDGISSHSGDLKDTIASVLGHTIVSPEQVKGAISGKALAFIYARTTAFVAGIREDCWDGMICPLLNMLLRMVMVLDRKKPGSVYVQGVDAVRAILGTFEQDVEGDGLQWFGPEIRPLWGAFFDPTPEEEKTTVDMVVAAVGGGVITREVALEKLRHVFPFESASDLVEDLDEEAAAKQEAAMDQAKELARVPKPGAKQPPATPTAKAPDALQ